MMFSTQKLESKPKALRNLIVIAVAVTSSLPFKAMADDVYNFYFQKGGAPQSVVQGGSGQSASASPEEVRPIRRGPPARTEEPVYEPEESVSSAMSTKVSERWSTPTRSKKVELGFGLYRVSDDLGAQRAYSLAGQYNFNRFLGVRVQGHFLAPEDDNKTLAIDHDQTENRYGAMASVVFTPIQVQLVGHRLLDFAAHAGVMSQRRLGGMSKAKHGVRDVELYGRGYVGASATLALNDNVGVEAFASLLEGGELGRTGASMVFRF